MLGKLIKYEFRATFKLFLLAYGVLIVISLINSFIPWDSFATDPSSAVFIAKSIFKGVFTFLYVIILIGVVVLTLAAVIVRFYKNLLGDQGYLMFTLPVKPNALILSKLVVAFVWNVSTSIIVALSLIFFNFRQGMFDSIVELIREIGGQGLDIFGWTVVIIITLLLAAISSILQFYAAMAMGMHITKSRLGGTILGYLIIYAASQVISLIIMIPGMLIISADSGSSIMDTAGMVDTTNSIFMAVMFMSALSYVLMGIGCYIVAHKFLSKKLNLG